MYKNASRNQETASQQCAGAGGRAARRESRGVACRTRRAYLTARRTITRINKTNAETLDGEDTLTALIVRRDCMRMKIDIMRDFLEEARDLADRSMRSEIKVKSTVPVAEKRKEVDKLSQELRNLDSRIQQKNWLTDLL